MHTTNTDPAPQRSTTSQSDRWQEHRYLVQQVATAYEQLSYLPALTVHPYEPLSEQRSHIRNAESVEFGVDVDNAIRDAVKGQPDAPALIEAWKRLCLDPNVIGVAERRFIQRAGPIFAARGLRPKQYFVRIHRKVGEKIR